MKVFGKKTITIDCSWEFENNSELMSKLEYLDDDKFIDYCFEMEILKKDISIIQILKLLK